MHASSKWTHRTLALALVGSFAAPATAQKNTSDPRYKEGLKYEKEMNFAAAIAAFSSIPVEQRLPVTRIHLAKCEAGLGHMLGAEAALLAIIADPKVPETSKSVAQSDLDLLREKMPKLTLALDASAVGAKVTLDGTEVTTFPATRALDPGVHAVVATKGLKIIYKRDVTLEEGRKVDVSIDDPDAVANKVEETKDVKSASGAATPAPSPVPSSSSSDGGRGWAPWALAGAGVLFAGGFVFARVRVGSAKSERADACRLQVASTTCDDNNVSKIQTWGAVSYVSGALALAGLGVGVYLLVKPTEKSSTAVGVAPLVAPNVGGFSVQGSF